MEEIGALKEFIKYSKESKRLSDIVLYLSLFIIAFVYILNDIFINKIHNLKADILIGILSIVFIMKVVDNIRTLKKNN